jgi:hypothetical protein
MKHSPCPGCGCRTIEGVGYKAEDLFGQPLILDRPKDRAWVKCLGCGYIVRGTGCSIDSAWKAWDAAAAGAKKVVP